MGWSVCVRITVPELKLRTLLKSYIFFSTFPPPRYENHAFFGLCLCAVCLSQMREETKIKAFFLDSTIFREKEKIGERYL